MIREDFRFAHRTNWQFASNPLVTKLEELRKASVEILDLTESNPMHCEFVYPREKILRPLSKRKNLDYTPSPQGNKEAREAIREYYRKKGVEVPLERIFLTASTSEAYSFLFKLLINSGEGVLFPRPSYPLFDSLAELHDIKMEYFSLQYKNGWGIDIPELIKKIHAHMAAIVLVNPNNPTGSYVKGHELKAINEVCLKKELALISDEVFWDFQLDSHLEGKASLANNQDVLSFTLGGISKTLGLPQMKLSWIILSGPEKVVEAAINRLEIISDTYLSVSTPVQNSLPDWLLLAQDIQDQMSIRLKENLRFLKEQWQAMSSCQVFPVEGGWYAVIKIPDNLEEEEWLIRLLEHEHVFIHPGYFFSFPQEGFMVVSLLTPIRIFQDGLLRVLNRLK